MPDRPAFVDLLNALAVAERRGHALLSAWRAVTADADLARTLDLVAIRQQANGSAMVKRLAELGHLPVEPPPGDFQSCLDLAGSAAPDEEKFRRLLGFGGLEDGSDPLARIFEDRSIDPVTGALFGSYIAEARDSEARLRAIWQRNTPAVAGISDQDVLAEVTERIDRLARTLEELKALRR